jgi:hypothetical protein
MKKVLKIFLWVVIIVILLCVLIYFFFFKIMWPGMSLKDRMKIVNSVYEKCEAKGGEDCQWILANNLQKAITANEYEYADLAADKNSPLEERMIALGTFYNVCRQKSETMDETEGSIYFLILQDQENPEDLRNMAMEFLAGTKTSSENFNDFQLDAIKSEVAPTSTKLQAIEAIKQTKSANDEQINTLIKALEDPVPEVSVRAKSALTEMGDRIKDRIPELLAIGLDENKSILSRNGAIDVIGTLARDYNIKDQSVADKIIPLIHHSHYVIRSSAAETLYYLTGNNYEIKEGTESEILNIYGLE